ncbi:protein hemingway-like isoform X2 [Bolinopsis microptera]|uniref:protein hemingway-like isoform X2 n=1 Tax=Bolinopsis microptera TaxID=2820187 RepID=UPI003079124D
MLLDISLSLFALLCLCESGHYTLENKTGDGSLGADGSLGNMVFPEGAGLESLSLIIERANQSFIRMKSISTEADKAASEMEELINILQKFRVKDGSTESDYPSTQLPLEEDVSSSVQLPESTTDESEEEAEDENNGESDYPSTQLPLEEDVSSSGQLPESTTDESEEEAEDENNGESDYPSTQLPLEEDVSSSVQLPESTTDESEEEAEDENYSESDYPSTQLPLEEDITSSGQLPESTTDESEEEAEDENDGESDYPSTQLPPEEDVSSSGQLPESTTDESEEEAEDENNGESDYPSTQLPLEEDVSSSVQLPESTTDESEEEAEDTNYSESDYPSTQLPLEEDITSSGQLPESTTDESEEEAEDGTPYTTRPEGSTEPLTVFPEADDQALPFNCHYNFTSQQIPGNPKSTCATWLLDNYHKHKEGWRSCHDADYHRYDESGLFEKTTCSDYTSQCGSDQTDKACCAMVLCEIQRVTFFYQGPNKKIEEAEEDEEGTEPEEGPHDLATGACQDRYHHNLDNACVKWMFEHYHLVKTRFRWQRCSEFDYSKHSKKGCGKLKRQCEKAEAKKQSSANELCCASINCYGRRRHFLRLSG